ncbi:MAG: neutral/alkaline non-lysosomal ceramidase N-terminal domain-containing protein [Candidatus Hodarchaeota archaeon]
MDRTKVKVLILIFVMGLSIFAFPVGATACKKPKQKLMAGASALPITPMTVDGIPVNPDESPVFLAGFGDPGDRPAAAVHDDIYVRSLILNYGGTSIVLVALDLIGYQIDLVDEIRQEVEIEYGINANNIIIACTHTHSGPDTLGLWTPPFPVPGVNGEYMEYIGNQIVNSIAQAFQNMEKARIRYASTTVPGLMKNSRDSGVVYPDLDIMKLEDRRGNTISVMINYAGHPEVLWSDNLEITSDYVGYLRDKVEDELGGIAIFFNGALGGMITPDVEEHTFEKAQEIGYALADATISALKPHRWLKKEPPKIEFNVEKQIFSVPLENIQFYGAMQYGMLHRGEPWYVDSPGLGVITTEVNVITIGNGQMITMPGEVLPSIGFRLREAMTAKYKFQIGLGNDELGYIIPEDEWDDTQYEESMSVGVQTGIMMEAILMAMLEGS